MAAIKVENETLCWKCKCATNPAGTNCPWADKGKPVPGWEAKLGKVIYTQAVDGGQQKYQAYIVKQCPLFVKDYEFSTMQDVYEELAKTLGISIKSAKVKVNKKIARWEQLTGRTMPLWVKFRNQDGIEEEEDE